MATLAFNDVTLRFAPGITALDRISLTLRSGEYTLLVGANGAGKSALLRVASRLTEPTAGSLDVSLSRTPWKEADFRRSVRLVPQHPGTNLLGQTVREDLEISARTAGLRRDEIAEETERFSLGPLLDRPVHALSGGEQRRVALAGAVMGAPELLLFDEPFLELDYHSTLEFLSLRRTLSAQGVGIVIATHDYHRTAAEADRMLILEGGSVAVDAPPQQAVAEAPKYALRPAVGPLETLLWGAEKT